MQIAFTLPMLNFRNPQLLDEQIFSERLHPHCYWHEPELQ
jgi:hypothetical protein